MNIAENAIGLAARPDLKPLMTSRGWPIFPSAMVRDSLDSFINNDPDKARAVCKSDDQVDSLKRQILGELSTIMIAEPGTIARGMDLILISRNLERIADLATNISEDTIYICQAKVIKHRIDQQPR